MSSGEENATITVVLTKSQVEALQQHETPIPLSEFVTWLQESGIKGLEGKVIHELDSASLLALWTLLILTIITIWGSKFRRLRWVHESGLAMLYGVIAGIVIQFGPWGLQSIVSFNPEIFFYALLPPIILNAGYTLDTTMFFRHFVPIVVFSVPGTIITAFITGALSWVVSWVPAISIPLDMRDALMFGSLISATDTVTVLAIFRELGVDPSLYHTVFGESALNDAVAISLFQAVESYRGFGKAVGDFFLIFGGSIFLGTFVAVICALITKHVPLHRYYILESSLFLIVSYMVYLIAEVCHLSGIIAILLCGIVQAHYTRWNLSPESQTLCGGVLELLSFMSESFIFSYLGISLFTFPGMVWKPLFALLALAATLFARAVSVFFLSFILNKTRRPQHRLKFSHQIMMWFSGLRGAVAFALAIENAHTPETKMILSTTLFIVVITVYVAGSLAIPLAERLKMTGNSEDTAENEEEDPRLVDPRVKRFHDATDIVRNRLENWFAHVGANVITPFLVKPESLELSGWKRPARDEDQADLLDEDELTTMQLGRGMEETELELNDSAENVLVTGQIEMQDTEDVTSGLARTSSGSRGGENP
eukprot:comp7606_c0_seq1/m.3260 comp7606_c0_seq1/g.3260  ORF comp7606_c0_seq1/g.3260 comp7606_c0_seq1/m.3260 type:complete len:596 (-) comp7606_c0_seq1:226-2013(-)